MAKEFKGFGKQKVQHRPRPSTPKAFGQPIKRPLVVSVVPLADHELLRSAMAIQEQCCMQTLMMPHPPPRAEHSPFVALPAGAVSSSKNPNGRLNKALESTVLGYINAEFDKPYGQWHRITRSPPSADDPRLRASLEANAQSLFGSPLDQADRITIVHELYVHEDCKRRGVGSALLQHVELLAKAGGSAYLYMNTNTALKDSVPFYQARGFQVVSSMKETEWWGVPDRAFTFQGLQVESQVEMLKRL